MRLGAPRRARSRLSLIPLIDVMLVLLFFFMLVTSYVDVGRTKLELAPAGRAGPGGTGLDAQATVLSDGRLGFEGEWLGAAELAARMRERSNVGNGDRPELSLVPAPGVPLQALIAAWEALKAEGVAARLGAAAP